MGNMYEIYLEILRRNLEIYSAEGGYQKEAGSSYGTNSML